MSFWIQFFVVFSMSRKLALRRFESELFNYAPSYFPRKLRSTYTFTTWEFRDLSGAQAWVIVDRGIEQQSILPESSANFFSNNERMTEHRETREEQLHERKRVLRTLLLKLQAEDSKARLGVHQMLCVDGTNCSTILHLEVSSMKIE